MNESVEQRHAIQKSARPMAQMEYQGIIWVIKADADKRIAELEVALIEIREGIKPFREWTETDHQWANEADSLLTEVYQLSIKGLSQSEGGADE